MELIADQPQQTVFGEIPSDWISCDFQDVLTGFSSGMTPYRGIEAYYKGDIPWITSGELNYNIISDTAEKITKEAVSNTNLKLLPTGTFLMAITGLEAEGTRGSCGITGVESTTNQSCMALFPIRGKIITEYLFHFYRCFGDMLALKYCQGTKQQSYTGGLVKILPIVLPPTLHEQRVISTALHNVDALIVSLDKLIEKKKAIKQGVMQELLTAPNQGGSQLDGFSDDWLEYNFGELLDYEQPTKYLVKSNKYEGQTQTPVLTAGKTFILGYTDEQDGIYSHLPVIIFDDFTTASKYVDFNFKAKSSAMKMLKLTYSEMSLKVIYSILKRVNYPVGDHKRHWIGEFRKIRVKAPSVEEQKVIDSILTNIDSEIETLVAKRKKFENIKLGMMQELLKGKTRIAD